MTIQELPDDYLNMPVFRQHACAQQVDALLDTLGVCVQRFETLLCFQDVDLWLLPQSVQPAVDHDLTIDLFEDALRTLLMHCQLVFDFGFADILQVDVASHQQHCQQLAHSLDALLARVREYFAGIPRDLYQIYFYCFQKTGVFQQCVQYLHWAAMPCAALPDAQQPLRLRGMLQYVASTAESQLLARDQDRLRVIAQLLFQDLTLAQRDYHQLTYAWLHCMQQVTLLGLLSRAAFSSLLQLLLSDTIQFSVRKETYALLKKQLLEGGLSLAVKLDYYTVFLSQVQGFCRQADKGPMLQLICDLVDDDLRFFHDDASVVLVLTPLSALLACFHEYSHYVSLQGDERVRVCEKLHQRVALLDLTPVGLAAEVAAQKLQILLQMDVHLVRLQQRARPYAGLRIFDTADQSTWMQAYQDLQTTIWHMHEDKDFLASLLGRLSSLSWWDLTPTSYVDFFYALLHAGQMNGCQSVEAISA